MNEKVSIIVPVYKVEEYLPKCIESVMAQDYENWELILIDDGSPDGSGKVCDEYSKQDSRILTIHTPNHGVSHARNVGIDKASGKIICFIDSDDWVEKNYLSSMLKYSRDDDTVVYGNITHDRLASHISTVGLPYHEGDSCICSQAAIFLTRNRIPENGYPVAKFFRKRIVDKFHLRFDERISLHEDHLFVLQYLMHVDKIVLSAQPCYHYVHRETSASLSAKKHPAENMIIASDALINAVDDIVDKFQIIDKNYVKILYTKLGLSQLIRSVQAMTPNDRGRVGATVRKRLRFFVKYYTPAHFYARLIPIIFMLRLDRILLLLNNRKK